MLADAAAKLPDPSWITWVLGAIFVVALAGLDFYVLNPKNRVLTGWEIFRNNAIMVAAAGAAGLALVVFTTYGWTGVIKYFAGYVSEESLSIDNLFIMAMLITSYRVKAKHERRVLLIGMGCAMVLRCVFIGAGLSIIDSYQFVGAIFGAFLLYTAITTLRNQGKEETPLRERGSYKFMLWATRGRVTDEQPGAQLTVRGADGIRRLTPYGQCAFMLMATGIVFAMDSIPVVIAVTDNPFLAMASNLMAVMGMLSIFAAFNHVAQKMPYIGYGVAVILAWVAADLVIGNPQLMGWFFSWHLETPLWFTPALIAAVLLATAIAGLIWRPAPEPAGATE